MASDAKRERAATPEDIPRLFRQFVAAGDFAGLATLYEPDAVVALPAGKETRGSNAIAEVFRQVFAERPAGGPTGQLQPVLYCGDLALTSTRLSDGRVTAEVARRQPDGSWRWVIDQPNV
ncbi:MAG: nuclear transport factor 2 family protein [Trueperaceae bacterium]